MILPLTLVAASLHGAGTPSPESVYGTSTAWTYHWVQGGKKVGHSSFRLEKAPAAGGQGLRVVAERTYDRDGISHRATSTTELADGEGPRRYEETLNVSALLGRRSEQRTEVSLSAGKAVLKYVQNGTKVTEREVDVEPGAHLLGSQAVEHWAALLATLEPGFEAREAKVFYPDFGESFTLSFKKGGEETLRIGNEDRKTIRYSFAATRYAMRGSVWLDEKGRLIQIEFPNAKDPNLTLRVTLAAPEAGRGKPQGPNG